MIPTQANPTETFQFDAALAARLSAVYMTPDVVEQRSRTLTALSLKRGEKLIDIGGAPGYLALDMAPIVGSGGRIVVVDVAESMLAAARKACAECAWIEVRQGDAQHLPNADGEFDVAVATQVFEFVPDVDAALAEAHRVLRPGGRLVLLDTDSDSIVWASSDPSMTARLLAAWDRHHADPHLPRTLASRLRRAGFDVDVVSVIPIVNTTYDENTLSFHLSKQIAEHGVKTETVAPHDASGWLQDLEERQRSRTYFFSLNRYVFAAHAAVID